MRGHLGGAAALVLLLGHSAAGAVEFSLQAGTARYEAEERLPDGRLFNRETGRLRQLTASLGQRPAGAGWGWMLQARRAEGGVDYDGRTQLGMPLATRTDIEQNSLDLRAVRHGTLLDGGLGWALGAGLGMASVDRDIQPTPLSSRLTETLRSQHALMAAELSAASGLGGTPVLGTLALQWRSPWRQTLRVDTHGALDGTQRLEPARRAAWRGEVRLEGRVRPSVSLSVAAHGELYRPGRSEPVVVSQGGVPVGTMDYPGSRQKTWGLLLGVSVSSF